MSRQIRESMSLELLKCSIPNTRKDHQKNMEPFKRGDQMKKLRYIFSVILLLTCFVFSGVSVRADDTLDENALAGMYAQPEAETEPESTYANPVRG